MSLRIIAGELKGRVLRTPDWDGLRPTSDRLRETLFNMLGPSVAGTRVLDVCAGTGAIALEALSRGAQSATCLEHDGRAAALIAANAAACGVSNRCIIVRGAVPEAVSRQHLGAPFDLVVLDPPYDAPWLAAAVAAAGTVVTPDGQVVLEHAARVAPPEVPGLVLARTRRAGDSALSFYRPPAVATRRDEDER